MVKPAGTGRLILVISASPAPFPPSTSRQLPSPFEGRDFRRRSRGAGVEFALGRALKKGGVDLAVLPRGNPGFLKDLANAFEGDRQGLEVPGFANRPQSQ